MVTFPWPGPLPRLPAGSAAWASVACIRTKPGRTHQLGWRQEGPREAAAGHSLPPELTDLPSHTCSAGRLEEGRGPAGQPWAASRPAQVLTAHLHPHGSL